MTAHNYQQKILMLQIISVENLFQQMRTGLVLRCFTFFDASNGSKTTINEKVTTLKTLWNDRLFLQHH